MHFPVIGECLGWRTKGFEELYGDQGQWSMTKELAREVSGFCISSPCEVWWIAESVLNMSRSTADGTMSSWLLYFRNFTNIHTVSYIIWTPLWTKCASAAAILSDISAEIFLFSPHFDVVCNLSLNRRTATWNLFVKLIHHVAADTSEANFNDNYEFR